MAVISTSSISSVGKTTITVKMGYVSGAYDNGVKKVTESGYQWKIWANSTATQLSGSSSQGTVSYTQNGTGTTKGTVTIQLSYTKTTYTYDYYYQYSFQGTYDTQKPEFEYASNGNVKYTYRLLDSKTEGEKTTYIYSVSKYVFGTGSGSSQTETKTSTLSYYPHPSEFSFEVKSGDTWLVSTGIGSILSGLSTYQGKAQQRMSWKNQSAAASCPSMFSNKVLTAASLNAVYKYLGSTTQYAAGDRVSAAMFNGIASLINN